MKRERESQGVNQREEKKIIERRRKKERKQQGHPLTLKYKPLKTKGNLKSKDRSLGKALEIGVCWRHRYRLFN